jgi:hypothetical protein
MAKARDIAALAGLAGLAYANRDTLFGSKKDDKTNADTKTDAGASALKTPLESIQAASKKAPVDAKSSVQSNVLSAITAPKAASNDQASNQGVISPKSLTPAAKPQSKRNIVSKSQMDEYKNKFGQDKTLRDYMNSERASKNSPIKPVALPDSYKSGGMTASRRADGIATKGKTRGKIC